MNNENLVWMVGYLETIPQSNFSLLYFRRGQDYDLKCDSVGCAIGHCVVLDENKNVPRNRMGNIMYAKWSEKFTGIDANSSMWDWCFSSIWVTTDNTVKGVCDRIMWLISFGLPDNWKEQMYGKAELCYNIKT